MPRIVPLVATLISLFAAAFVPQVGALVRRHDVDDQDLVRLGGQFPAVGQVGGLADGTLVAPSWVLTAAHVARGAVARGRSWVRIDGHEIEVLATYTHPLASGPGAHDLALLQLARPVAGVRPLSIAPEIDARELDGAFVTLVGHGATGRGDDPERAEDGRRRAGSNRIHEARKSTIELRFDRPEEPAVTQLEVIPGPGDSGGPALILQGGQQLVVAVSSAGRPGTNGPGSYGALDTFARIDTESQWVRAVFEGSVRPDPPPAKGSDGPGARVAVQAAPLDPAELGDHPAGAQLLALLDALAGTEEALSQFVEQHFVPGDEAIAARRLAALRQLRDELGQAKLTSALRLGGNQVDGILNRNGEEHILGVRVDGTGKIETILRGRP